MAERPATTPLAGHASAVSTTIGRLETVALTEAEKAFPRNVAEKIALDEADMRKQMANRVMRLFRFANLAVLGLVVVIFASEAVMPYLGVIQARDRVIDSDVIKVLIGATAVQVGIIMVTIASYLFPRSRAG
jgi:hypothetical protein